MSSNQVRVGLVVTLNDRRGTVLAVDGANATVAFDDAGGVPETCLATNLRVPLHDGVFASDESVHEWRKGAASAMARLRETAAKAQRKQAAEIAGKGYDLAEDLGAKVPDDVKQIVDAANLYVPFLQYVPTDNDLAKEALEFITEALSLLAIILGLSK